MGVSRNVRPDAAIRAVSIHSAALIPSAVARTPASSAPPTRQGGAKTNRPSQTLFLARWPADRAVRHARDRIRELTGRDRLPLPPEAIVQDVSMFLRGWAGYFRFGHSARRLSAIRQYAWTRLSLFISKKHRRSRHFGWQVVINASPPDLGLISLSGIVVPPRANKPWREKPHAAGERRR